MRPNPRDARLEYHAAHALHGLRLSQVPLLIAVSGGPDSMALLHYMARDAADAPPIVAGHVNHALRGAESDADAAFVRASANAWNVPRPAARPRKSGRGSRATKRSARWPRASAPTES